jgi:hypothetical protein
LTLREKWDRRDTIRRQAAAMTPTSESTEAIKKILRAEFDAEPIFDKSRGRPNLTFRLDGRRYRVYVDDDFEEDYPVLKGQCERILDGLVFALSASARDAVIVTSIGVKEHAAADF